MLRKKSFFITKKSQTIFFLIILIKLNDVVAKLVEIQQKPGKQSRNVMYFPCHFCNDLNWKKTYFFL